MDGRAGCWWLHLALGALAAFPGAPTLAEPPSAAGPVYPVAVRLALEPEARAAVLVHVKGGGFTSPVNPDARVPVGAQARDAYLVLADRLFQPPGDVASDAALVVEEVRPTLTPDALGWRASVVHEVTLRAPGGEPLGRWSAKGEARVEGIGPGALPLAFARAARAAATQVEYELEQPPGVSAFLASRGVVVGRARPAPPAHLPVATTAPLLARTFDPHGPPRPAPIWFLDAGTGLSAAAGAQTGLAARAGVASGVLFAQAGLQWQTTLDPDPALRSDIDAWLLGIDAGVVLRPLRALEVRAGAGVSRLSASAVGGGASRTVPTFLLSALYAGPPSASTRGLRLGVEARKVVGGTLDFPSTGSGTEAVAVADLVLLLLVGWEAGW